MSSESEIKFKTLTFDDVKSPLTSVVSSFLSDIGIKYPELYAELTNDLYCSWVRVFLLKTFERFLNSWEEVLHI